MQFYKNLIHFCDSSCIHIINFVTFVCCFYKIVNGRDSCGAIVERY